MQKVLLAYRCSEEGESNPFERVLPVGVGYIHAWLRSRGVPTVLANFSGVARARIRSTLETERPDVVGISTFTFNRRASIELSRIVRRTLPRAHILLGGPHPTHAGVPLLEKHPEIDACVLGEGELTLERYVRALDSRVDPGEIPGLLLRRGDGVASTGSAEPIVDLDALPFPALYPDGYGVDPRAQYPYVVTSRGCPAKCTFCSSPEFWGSRVRHRSAANILDELELLRDRFGILYVSFRDDIFTVNKKRIIELCRGMIERRLCLLWDCQTRVNTIDEERLVWMKRAGCIVVQYGIESGSQAILDRLRKGQRLDQIERAADASRRAGLILSVYLISGVPGETETDLAETEKMIRRIRPHDGIVTPLAVFPGTNLWDQYSAERGIDESLWEGVGRDGIFVRPERFTEKALLRLGARLEEAGAENAYGPGDYALHRRHVGECYATDLLEGESLERMGRTRLARSLYERLAAREPWNPWPLVRLGRIALTAGEPASAEGILARASALVPAFADARRLRADALRALDRGEEAARVEEDLPPRAGARRRVKRSRRGFQSFPPPRPPESRGAIG